MSDADSIELEGVVISFSRDIFIVEIAQGDKTHTVQCKPSGKMRQHSIKIVPGDQVKIEVSPYDLTKGRIIYRSR